MSTGVVLLDDSKCERVVTEPPIPSKYQAMVETRLSPGCMMAGDVEGDYKGGQKKRRKRGRSWRR